MRFRNVLYVTHHFIRSSGNAHDYFRARAERFFVFSITPTFVDRPCVLDEFRNGQLVSSREYGWHRGRSVPLQYVFFYLAFLHAIITRIPKRTIVITFHPLFCVGSGVLKALRGHRTILWLFDYFPGTTGLYGAYNRIADYYVRSLNDVFYVSPVMAEKYKQRLGPWRADARHEAVELAILKTETHRRPQVGRIGFVGNFKEGQGIELAMQAMAKDRSLTLDLIGDGISADALRQLAMTLGVNDRITWHGAITDDAVMARISERWEAGLAPYASGDYLECADPGKVKLYWQFGVPVIMTRVSHIADKAEKAGAAAIITPDVEAFLAAISDIRARSDEYRRGVENMRQEYESGAYFDRVFGRYALPAPKPFPTANDRGPDNGTKPLVTVVVPTRDRKAMLLRLLESVYSSDYPRERLEVIVVDNTSVDGTAEAVESAFSDVRVLRQKENLWSGGGRSAGEDAARGIYVFFIDDDNVVDPNCINALVAAMEANPELGVAAPRANYLHPAEKLWCADARVDWWGRVSYPRANTVAADLPPLIDADFFPNAYMVRGSFAKGGLGHDRNRFPHNWNEADYCARVRAAGYRTVCVAAAVTHHDIDYQGPFTRVGVDKTFDQARSRVRYRRVHMNTALQWLAFFLVVFPYSTALYARAFTSQKEIPLLRLVSAYLRGTVQGFRGTL